MLKLILFVCCIAGVWSSELIVQLMEWRFEDVARECEDFLHENGYTAVQVSPVSENLVLPGRPWYERYQVMSYKVATRSGDADAFKKMTERCSKVGIRVYVDVILNHMTATQPTPPKGTNGSVADPSIKSYPGVPYNMSHFHPTCDITDYNNATNVRVCELVTLHDLDQGQEYVKEKLAEHLNNLIDLGATGFRIDAAKHMYPNDIEAILNRTKAIEKYGKPFVYQEVPDDGGAEAIHPPEYFNIGLVTEFKFGTHLRLHLENLTQWVNLDANNRDIGLMPSDRAVVFTDNHDRQRDFTFNFNDVDHYKLANAFLLSWPYGDAKKVMSSFNFANKNDGPPHNEDDTIKEVTIKDGKCGNGWVCEHRWPEIKAMARFSRVVDGTGVTGIKTFSDSKTNSTYISYQRTGKGFVILSLGASVNGTFNTGLPQGEYCDVISEAAAGKKCGGQIVRVTKDGSADFSATVKGKSALIIALHVEAKKGSSTTVVASISLLCVSLLATLMRDILG